MGIYIVLLSFGTAALLSEGNSCPTCICYRLHVCTLTSAVQALVLHANAHTGRIPPRSCSAPELVVLKVTHCCCFLFFFVTYYILSSCLSGVAELFYFFIFWSIFADLLMCNVGYLCNTSYVILLASFLQRIDHRWSFVSWKFGCNVVHTNTECIYVFLIMNREKLYRYTHSKYLNICLRYVKILCPDILLRSFWTLIRSVSLQFIGTSQ